MIFTDLYHPPDVAAAVEAWRASCGPAALALLLAALGFLLSLGLYEMIGWWSGTPSTFP